ncbi:MAG: non-homologous end joining protein Ku [Candidatus Dormibacteria bacterium]
MPRSMWRGAISFGMVAIPVRLYLATESKSVSFRMLCPDCHTPIRNKRWCPNEDKEVAWNATVRGYEVGKDEFVVVDDSDLDSLPLSTAHTIDILEFCDDAEIEAGLYIKGAYYLEPEAVGVKPYYLLKAALETTGRVAVGKIAFRDREHLVRLALHDRGILMNTLHWPDEIRDAAELSLPEAEVTPDIHKRELDMAVMLIDNLTATFDPERYHDEYRDALTAVVEAKLNQQPLHAPEVSEPARVTDLMAALKASVEAARASGAAIERSGTATAARRRAPASEAARRRKAS